MTQSRSVWRSMPAARAASSRLMPSSALAIARMRRVMRASLSPLARLRSTLGVRSRRIDSADILPSIESMVGGNHEQDADGILQREQQSGEATVGITHWDEGNQTFYQALLVR